MRPPRPHLKTAPTALKKLSRVDTPTFFNRSGMVRARPDHTSGSYGEVRRNTHYVCLELKNGPMNGTSGVSGVCHEPALKLRI